MLEQLIGCSVFSAGPITLEDFRIYSRVIQARGYRRKFSQSGVIQASAADQLHELALCAAAPISA